MNRVQLPLILLVCLVSACGGSGGSGSNDSSSSGVTLATLSRDFPVSENGNFSTPIGQSFVCVDEIDQEYYQLVFDGAGNIDVPGFGIGLTYTTTNNQLDIDVSNAFGAGVSYQHLYHIHAGELVVGFIGNLTDGLNNAAIACIAAEHNYSDSVPVTTTIACRSSGANNSFDFNANTTNVFSLEPGHYAQRNFQSFTYSGGGVSSISLSLSTERLEHGTYLYDQASGEFVMGFMRVDMTTPDLELLVFEGSTNGTDVTVELGSSSRDCVLE